MIDQVYVPGAGTSTICMHFVFNVEKYKVLVPCTYVYIACILCCTGTSYANKYSSRLDCRYQDRYSSKYITAVAGIVASKVRTSTGRYGFYNNTINSSYRNALQDIAWSTPHIQTRESFTLRTSAILSTNRGLWSHTRQPDPLLAPVRHMPSFIYIYRVESSVFLVWFDTAVITNCTFSYYQYSSLCIIHTTAEDYW